MNRSASAPVAPPEYPEVAQAFHIANFVPANWGIQDPISRSLIGFQHGVEPDTTQWIRLVLQGITGLPPADLIVRALSADELAPASGKPLDRLGRELAARMGGKYEPHRIRKTRATRAVKRAGIRAERDRILQGAYAFDGEGFPSGGSVLIIDDCVTTGATFGAIASAITSVHPLAVIRFLALGRTDPWLVRLHLGEEYSGSGEAYRESLVGNTHLDSRYFSGESASAERRRQGFGTTSRRQEDRDSQPLPSPTAGPVRTFGEEESGDARGGVKEVIQERGVARGVPAEAGHPPPRSGERGIRSSPSQWPRTIGTAVGVVALVIVAFLLSKTGATPEDRGEPIPAPQAPAFVPPAVSAQGRDRPRVRTDQRPRGTINVPSVGLRREPAVTASSIEGVIVTEGERVAILQTARGETGPEWIQIETARGARGWVIAPVVTRAR